jgi:hypothetical protein
MKIPCPFISRFLITDCKIVGIQLNMQFKFDFHTSDFHTGVWVYISCYQGLTLPSAWVQNKKSFFDWQIINSIISASTWPKTIFLHRQILIFFHGIFSFTSMVTASPLSYLASSTPMRSSNLQVVDTVKVKQGQGCGVWGKYSDNIKFTLAWRSIINFFQHIEVWHGPQIICRCRRQS